MKERPFGGMRSPARAQLRRFGALPTRNTFPMVLS